MAKPLDEFGGWLKFFYVIEWISVIVGILGGAFVLIGVFNSVDSERIYFVLLFTEIAVGVWLTIRIIRTVKLKDVLTPSKIIKLLTIVAAVTLIFSSAEIFVAIRFPWPSLEPKAVADIGRDVIQTLVWAFIWINYFKKSKRVHRYYGLTQPVGTASLEGS